MNKLGSEFLREFGEFERPILFGRTKRQLIFALGMVLSVGFTILFWYLKWPDVFTYLVMAVVLPPFVLVGMGKDEELKERYKFRLTIQERAYLTEVGKEKKFTKYDFIQHKNICEANQG